MTIFSLHVHIFLHKVCLNHKLFNIFHSYLLLTVSFKENMCLCGYAHIQNAPLTHFADVSNDDDALSCNLH